MKVKKLILNNYRNFSQCTFVPDRQINFLIGENGKGKTSVLEAIGYLASLKSFRGSHSEEIVKWGEKSGQILGVLSSFQNYDQPWETELRITFGEKKSAFINDKVFKSSTQYLSQRFGSHELGFHAVVFNPSDHDLVRGEPSVRRAYLDKVISAENLEYLKTLHLFKKVLEQRNSLLKNAEKPSSELLLGFTEPLVTYSAFLVQKRLEWIQRLQERLNNTAHSIHLEPQELRLVYISNWVPEIDNLSYNNNNLESIYFAGHGEIPSLELLEKAFWKKATFLEAAEWKSKHTLVGPQRDDWTFFRGRHVLKGHGSQGEVRSALLALKLCEVELFCHTTQHRPVFLLDDFSSELDRQRRFFLLSFLEKTDLQVFVTSTEDQIYGGKRFYVANESIKEAGHDNRAERHQQGN